MKLDIVTSAEKPSEKSLLQCDTPTCDRSAAGTYASSAKEKTINLCERCSFLVSTAVTLAVGSHPDALN